MNLYDRNQKQRSFFNEKIDSYDDTHAEFMLTKNALADSLEPDVKRILDLGVGTGLELIHLFELFPNAEVTAIDITENMLEALKNREFASRVKTICGDFFEVDFGEEYDAVISTSALHHFTPEEKLVLYRKVFECLRKRGMFINCDKISLSLEEQERCLYELEHNIENYKHMDTPLTVDSELSILEQVGFSDINTSSVDKENYQLIKARK